METRCTLKGKIPLLLFIVLCTTIRAGAQSFYASSQTAIDTTLLELPKISHNEVILFHEGYVTSFNPETLTPKWVAYDLTKQELNGIEKRTNSFTADPLYIGPQPHTSDYTNSTYDRGHMAPAADMKWSATAMRESFYLTNVCPQTPSLNRRYWLSLEELARRMAIKYGNVWIICGPIQGTDITRIGKNGVAVPTAFFKAFLAYDGEQFIGAGFVMENDSYPHTLQESIMSIDNLETFIQMDLFCHLNEEDAASAESIVCLQDWDID